MEYYISPPNTQFTNPKTGFLTAEGYRFLSQGNRQGNGVTTAPIVTLSEDQQTFPNSRALAVTSGQLTRAETATTVTLGLANSGVTADTYGEPTRILVLAIDAKGRVTNAQEIKLDVSDVDGTLAVGNGGTGLTTYAVGDLIYASGTDVLSQLADVAVGNVLKSGGVGAPPAYGQVDLTSDVTGVLPAANGGFPGGFSGSGAYTNFTFNSGVCVTAS